MATLTIRKIDDGIKKKLRMQAALHDRSMEEEARTILTTALVSEDPKGGLGNRIHDLFHKNGGIDLELPARTEKPRAAEMKKGQPRSNDHS